MCARRRLEDAFTGPLITLPDVLFNYMQDKWREEAENKPLKLNTRLSAALNKQPVQWVNAACQNAGLSTKGKRKDRTRLLVARLTDPAHLLPIVKALPAQGRQVLRRVLEADGWIKYGPLERKFGSELDDGWFWDEHPPTSAIGVVRACGLLFVGKAPIGSRNYRVAIIPADLRPLLTQLLGITGNGSEAITDAL